ncbi:MAG: hypothetical protein ACREEB_11440 [Caulobacteraceae bacterium]
MPTLDGSWTGRLRFIGDLERPDHYYLTEEDRCFFLGEYTARAGWQHSSTNRLIINLKKKRETRHTPQWAHKQRAIHDIAQVISRNLNAAALANTMIVPIPPSKPAGNPGYDDRMVRVAHAINSPAVVNEVLVTTCEREAMHVAQHRRDRDALRATLAVRANLIPAITNQIILLDDVLTTGCSFGVCKSMLLEHCPDAKVLGIFVARRVIDHSVDWGDLDLLNI